MFDRLRKVRRQVQKAPITAAPEPWRETWFGAVGGLTEVGFLRGSDLLLVVSSQGRAVFDCDAGDRVARDREEPAEHWYQPQSLLAHGIGPLAGKSIALSGLHGGGLSSCTADGWWSKSITLRWPKEELLLGEPFGSLFEPTTQFWKLGTELEVRAFGFSPTGRSLLVATSSDLRIWSRAPDRADEPAANLNLEEV